MIDQPIFVDRETIRLTKDGIFLSDGEEITHSKTVDAFHRNLGRDGEGYFIAIGKDFKRIEVEDTAYFVTAIEWETEGKTAAVMLQLSDHSRETLDPETLTYTPPDRLTCRIKSGKEEAKFLRRAYLDILMNSLSERDGYSIEVGGKLIRLGRF